MMNINGNIKLTILNHFKKKLLFLKINSFFINKKQNLIYNINR